MPNGPLRSSWTKRSASASEIFAGCHSRQRPRHCGGSQNVWQGSGAGRIAVPGWSTALDRGAVLHPNGPGHPKAYSDYEDDFDVRLQSGELYHADSMPLVDSLRYRTPLGREVFGGSIAPDVFVPWDSAATSSWVSEWIWTGCCAMRCSHGWTAAERCFDEVRQCQRHRVALELGVGGGGGGVCRGRTRRLAMARAQRGRSCQVAASLSRASGPCACGANRRPTKC